LVGFSDGPAAAKAAAAAPGISIESDERPQLDGRGVSMIDRKPFENGSNPDREREEAIMRGVRGGLEPSKPWLARRNGISSTFRSRHMGNVG
jgi:hypothetical protein